MERSKHVKSVSLSFRARFLPFLALGYLVTNERDELWLFSIIIVDGEGRSDHRLKKPKPRVQVVAESVAHGQRTFLVVRCFCHEVGVGTDNTYCLSGAYIATDGSAPDGKGSFAWLISDGTGNTLAQCMGPVFGAGVTSFRAEGYGILSLLRFLLRLRQVHHPPLETAEQTNPQDR
jgi:hypothetical protein